MEKTKKKQKHICPQCGKEFYSEGWKKQKFCSVRCGAKFNGELRRVDRDERKCIFCGKLFEVERWRPQKFCSVKCAHNSIKRTTYENRICLNCGKKFQIQPFKPNKYCSVKCWGLANRKKGKNGVRTHALQNGQGQYLHRLVMEEQLGRKLLPTERVHHIDMNKFNNKIDNLYLFPNESKHQIAHKSLEKVVSLLLKSNSLKFRDGRYVQK